MVGQSHFLRQRLFSVSLCIGIALLNGSAWSAKPEPETEWKPPKLPEAVTIKPEGGVLEISSIDRTTRPEIEQAAAQIDSIKPAAEDVQEFIEIYNKTIDRLNQIN